MFQALVIPVCRVEFLTGDRILLLFNGIWDSLGRFWKNGMHPKMV